MSQFSEYLKILVEESGSSVSALARAAGLNRPNLQNVMGGSRKPARGDVEKLLPHLRASAEQREKLLELLEELSLLSAVSCWQPANIASTIIMQRRTAMIVRIFFIWGFSFFIFL